MTSRVVKVALTAALLLSLLATVSVSSQELVLRSEFWAESEPTPALPSVVDDKSPGPVMPDEVARSLLEEARRVFSAMVWGFEFVYIPYDKTRGVSETFRVTSLGEIAWGDPRLTYSETRTCGTQLRAYLEYRPDAAGTSRRKAWESASFETAQGLGTAPLFGDEDSRFKAMDEAAKEALRAMLRPIVKNKPREIRGTFAYAQAPRLTIAEGKYVAVLRIRAKISEIRAYAAY